MSSIITEKYDITPDKSIYPKLGQTGYSAGEAIAELVDNAIDARFADRGVKIDIKINRKEKIITVEDDGKGMGKETAAKSIVLGYSQKGEEELGRFGLGLKTACLSLGKKFTVKTKPKGNKEEYTIVFNEDEFLRNGDWNNFPIQIKKGADQNYSGTKITIENLRIGLYPRLFEKIKSQLQERFAPFIVNNETEIVFNNQPLKAERPKLIPRSKKPFEILLSNGGKITGWTGILEIGSQSKSGFNIYRKRRLIRAHEKLGYVYHPSKMWITGEINLDCIPVTHNKREFIIEDPLYIEFFEKFQEVLRPVLSEAQKRHREKKIQDLSPEQRETLKDNILKAIESVSEFRELAFPKYEEPLRRSTEKGDFFEKEKRAPRQNITSIKVTTPPPESLHGRKPRKTQIKRDRFITIAGKKYKFDYEWQDLEDDIPKYGYVDKDRGLIMIILNSKFPVLNIVKDLVFYVALYISEGIVEAALKENRQPLERTISLRDSLMQELARIITEDVGGKKLEQDSQMGEAGVYLLKNKEEKTAKLTSREKNIVEMRLGLGGKQKTLDEIGNQFKISRQRVEQILNQALGKINQEDEKKEHEVSPLKKRPIEQTFNKNIKGILEATSFFYGVPLKKIQSKIRKAQVAEARQVVIYLLREVLKLSFPRIGKILNRDHTTAIYSYKKVSKEYNENEKIKNDIENIKGLIK